MYAKIQCIEYHLPESTLTNECLAKHFPAWSPDKIKLKTGIRSRHIANNNETALDLAYWAAKKLFNNHSIAPEQIDYLLFCTQSPDYLLPTSACILQDKLNIPTSSGALDFNLGCSGYLYGLSLAKGLIETQQAKNILFLTGETYSKYINSNDVGTRTIFGDGASATLITSTSKSPSLTSFIFGTDGSGKDKLIVPQGGAKSNTLNEKKRLVMKGPDIFAFTIKSVPKAVSNLLLKSNLSLNEIDFFIFHQANEFMLKHLRDKIEIPKEKFYIDLEMHGNTVSSTIPIAIKDALTKKQIKAGDTVALVGFGVGYSWGACIIKIL